MDAREPFAPSLASPFTATFLSTFIAVTVPSIASKLLVVTIVPLARGNSHVFFITSPTTFGLTAVVVGAGVVVRAAFVVVAAVVVEVALVEVNAVVVARAADALTMELAVVVVGDTVVDSGVDTSDIMTGGGAMLLRRWVR